MITLGMFILFNILSLIAGFILGLWTKEVQFENRQREQKLIEQEKELEDFNKRCEIYKELFGRNV